ncbi:MAG: glycoside hydrolase family 28 protein [Deltaproteobacteria bacterium]|nr:glycoside hydrolase family 28 protein [Deltaproteobacteria bacterium]
MEGLLEAGPGVWATGPIELYSGCTLSLAEGAVISFIPEPARYPPVQSRWEGIECHAMHPCLFSSGQQDVAVVGRGSIDCNGAVWWSLFRDKQAAGQDGPESDIEKTLALLNRGYNSQPGGGGGRATQFLRPPAIQFFKCRNVTIRDITVINSPFWTIHPVYCENLEISGVTITNPQDAPNTDGIDIDSCTEVLVQDCVISVGDDGIALKSGSGPDGLRVNRPTRDVTVRNCTVGAGHGGIVIGSETAGGISQVLTEDCRFIGPDGGIRIKSRRGGAWIKTDVGVPQPCDGRQSLPGNHQYVLPLRCIGWMTGSCCPWLPSLWTQEHRSCGIFIFPASWLTAAGLRRAS